MRYDLIVVGSDPAGQKAAVAAAKLNKQVAIIERGAEPTNGTGLLGDVFSSQTLRETILHLTDDQRRDERSITMDDVRRKFAHVAEIEMELNQDQRERHGIDVFSGEARFIDPHRIELTSSFGKGGYQPVPSVEMAQHLSPDGSFELEGEKILIATGTVPTRPNHIPFDGERIINTNEFLSLPHTPKSMIIVGGGPTGMEYGLMLAMLGIEVIIVDGREQLLDSHNREIIDALLYHAHCLGTKFRLGEDVIALNRTNNNLTFAELESGERIVAETALYCAGQIGQTETLNLQAANLEVDERGRLWCNENLQTWQKHIYGVGDVVGFQSQVGPSVDQSQTVVRHAFDEMKTEFRHNSFEGRNTFNANVECHSSNDLPHAREIDNPFEQKGNETSLEMSAAEVELVSTA